MSAAEAPEHAPFIDYENLPAPTEGILVTHANLPYMTSDLLRADTRALMLSAPRATRVVNPWVEV